jgi:hypothetical protein
MAKTLFRRYTYEVIVENENKSQFKEPVIPGNRVHVLCIAAPKGSIPSFYSIDPWFDFCPEDSSSISPSSRKMLGYLLKIGHYRFVARPSHFITHPYPPNLSWGPCNPNSLELWRSPVSNRIVFLSRRNYHSGNNDFCTPCCAGSRS